MNHSRILALRLWVCLGFTLLTPGQHAVAGDAWLTDYGNAMQKARKQQQMMLIYFHPTEKTTFEMSVLGHESLAPLLNKVTCVKQAVDTQVTIGGQATTLLKHESFREMHRKPGLAMLDFTDPKTEHYGRVVSVLPFSRRKPDVEQVRELLQLPGGSLTQRTLMLAVRIHPEHPQSTAGAADPALLSASQEHSLYQARIRQQGHHNWNSRFHRINARLGANLVAQEVCAESWSGQTLWDAAIECVQSWRQSPGHWEAVRTRHVKCGDDMKGGGTGVWYATGVFARPLGTN